MTGKRRSPSGPAGDSTRCVHAGERQAPPREPAITPIYQTAPFAFGSAEELNQAFAREDVAGLYSRYANPTVRAVEEKLAALEGADDAVAFASGMGAITATLGALLRSGDRLLAAADLYGQTHHWLAWLRERHPEVAVDRVPAAGLVDHLAGGIPAETCIVYFETPTNPLLTCCDIARVAELAHRSRKDRVVVVDNTFATPIEQRPLALGADIAVYSATKFLAGHSDVTAGLAAGRRELIEPIREAMILGGACLDPHAAFLVGRGMKTLGLRLERQADNAARLAAFLRGHPRVVRVLYPGLDPVGRRQMRRGGGMLAFEAEGGLEAASRLLDRLEVFRILPSLGGVESGVLLPATTSHRQLSRDERAALGIGDGLIRVSCGIEDGDDLEADLAQALG